MLGGLYILIDASANHNYMRGKEYGQANWASVAAINSKFENKSMNHGTVCILMDCGYL